MTEQFITKYRPQKLDEITGHGAICDTLEHTYLKDPHRAHAFLFSGAPGLGKTTLALIMARELGCGDVREISGATESGVDEMREQVKLALYPPLGSDRRATIVDECHNLSTKAWDSLLIELENPAEFNYWFFCTSQHSKVPKAILRRCADFKLGPASDKELEKLLVWVAAEEKLKPGAELLGLCIRSANGSPGQALANLSITANTKHIDDAEDLLARALGSTEGVEIARALVKGARWSDLMALTSRVDVNKIESVRFVVTNYLAKVVLSDNTHSPALLQKLDAFSQPFATNEGHAPLLLALHRALKKD